MLLASFLQVSEELSREKSPKFIRLPIIDFGTPEFEPLSKMLSSVASAGQCTMCPSKRSLHPFLEELSLGMHPIIQPWSVNDLYHSRFASPTICISAINCSYLARKLTVYGCAPFAVQNDGAALYVHCWGGRGRAGTIGACLYMLLGPIAGFTDPVAAADEALEVVQRLLFNPIDFYFLRRRVFSRFLPVAAHGEDCPAFSTLILFLGVHLRSFRV